MKVILNLPCELEEIPKKLNLLTRIDWEFMCQSVEEQVYGKEESISAVELFQRIEGIRKLLVDFDGKLETVMELLKGQQATVLGIGASAATAIATPVESPTTEEMRQTLEDYDDGTGLPTGSE
jgi:hypothetical protein